MIRAELLAAPLLLAAAPAHAQRIDTSVENVVDTGDGYRCTSHAYPELRLSHDWRGGDRSAVWDKAAREPGSADLHLKVAFAPDEESQTGAHGSVLGFQLDFAGSPLAADPRAGHLRIDGKPDPTPLLIDGDRESLALAVAERNREDLAVRLARASIVELDLIDGTGAELGRFSWDVRSLRRAAELLEVIHWSCR